MEDKQPISRSHEEHYHFHSCSFERLQPDVFLGVEPHERGVCTGVLLYKQTKCRKSVFMGPPLRRRGGVKVQLRFFFSSELHGVKRSASSYGRFTPPRKRVPSAQQVWTLRIKHLAPAGSRKIPWFSSPWPSHDAIMRRGDRSKGTVSWLVLKY